MTFVFSSFLTLGISINMSCRSVDSTHFINYLDISVMPHAINSEKWIIKCCKTLMLAGYSRRKKGASPKRQETRQMTCQDVSGSHHHQHFFFNILYNTYLLQNSDPTENSPPVNLCLAYRKNPVDSHENTSHLPKVGPYSLEWPRPIDIVTVVR